MKIKTVKKMNVLELAQAVRDGIVKGGTYYSVMNRDTVNVTQFGLDLAKAWMNHVVYDDYFTVETLEELTEETEIPCDIIAILMADDGRRLISMFEKNISVEFLYRNISDGFVYQKHKDGSIGQLIWSKKNGFADGVLEVEE